MFRLPGLRRAARLAFWPLAGAVGFLALYPDAPQFDGKAAWGLMQYGNHVLAFTSLTTVGVLAWGAGRRIVMGLAAGAVAVELAQAVAPKHQPALLDLGASLAGIAIGLALMRACSGRWPRAKA